MIYLLAFFLFLPVVVYFFIQLYFVWAWAYKSPGYAFTKSTDTKVAIIIPFRNEENNLKKSILGLQSQNYPAENLEIIFVNDHSEDNSVNVIADNILNSSTIKLIHLPHQLTGKKAAIEFAINSTSSTLIILTDADCVHGNNYVLTLASFYSAYKPQLIAAEVEFANSTKLFEQIQELELSGLMLITGSAFFAKTPILCNGANMAFEKSFFHNVNGYAGNQFIAGGDDIFLLQKAKKLKAKTMFLKHIDSRVTTPAQNSVKQFFDQRNRWAYKSKHYSDKFSILVSFSVFLCSIALFSCAFLSIVLSDKWLFYTFIFMLFIKASIDFLLLFLATHYSKKLKLLWLFPIAEIFQIIYVCIIGIRAVLAQQVNWKGRKIKSGKKI